MKLHERLKSSRRRMDLTQDEVGKALGLPRQSISRFERERGNESNIPNEKYLDRYDQVLGLPPGTIFQWIIDDKMAERREAGVDTPASNINTDEPLELGEDVRVVAYLLENYAPKVFVKSLRVKLEEFVAGTRRLE